jgi:hypothetical protein
MPKLNNAVVRAWRNAAGGSPHRDRRGQAPAA